MSEHEVNQEVETQATEAVQEQAAPVSFLDSISEEYRGESSLQDFKSVDDLAKSYVNAQKMIGSSIRIPSEEAGSEQLDEFYRKLESIDGVVRLPKDDEGWAQFYNKLGRPEDHSQYDLGLPEDMEINQEVVSNFTQLAHKIGLTTEQARAIAGFQASIEQATNEHNTKSFNETKAEAEQILKDKWGTDYNNRLAGAKAIAQQYAEHYPEAMEALAGSEAANNPAFLSMLSDLYSYMKEDGVITSAQPVQYGTSREEALQKIQDIQMNSQHAYWNPNDPGHDTAKSMMEGLFKVAYPD